MTKFKSIPNQGTKTIGLPIVGDIDFVDGVTEMDNSQAEDLSKLNFGFKLVSTDAKIIETEATEGDKEEEEEEEIITKESLMSMTTQSMKDFMVDAFSLTEVQVGEITKGKKKEEVADEILERINAIPPTN